MTNKILCDRCYKILEPWRYDVLVKFLINLWRKDKRKQDSYDLCDDCRKEFGKFMKFDLGGLDE